MTQICFQTPHCGWPRNLNVQLLHKADCGEERVCRQRQFCPYEEPLVLHLTHHTSHCALLRSGHSYYTRGNYMLRFEHRVAH